MNINQSYYWDEESQQYLAAARSSSDPWKWVGPTITTTNSLLCPDLLRLSDIGEADNWRGRVVRGFFRLLGWVTGV